MNICNCGHSHKIDEKCGNNNCNCISLYTKKEFLIPSSLTAVIKSLGITFGIIGIIYLIMEIV